MEKGKKQWQKSSRPIGMRGWEGTQREKKEKSGNRVGIGGRMGLRAREKSDSKILGDGRKGRQKSAYGNGHVHTGQSQH